MLPAFTTDGVLPVGVHAATWREFAERFATSPRRVAFFMGLVAAARALAAAGSEAIYVGGSYVTAKAEPGDFDACWSVFDVDFDALDPVFADFSDERAAQKERLGGELFPAEVPELGTGLLWVEFFQMDRVYGRKGIVRLPLGEMT